MKLPIIYKRDCISDCFVFYCHQIISFYFYIYSSPFSILPHLCFGIWLNLIQLLGVILNCLIERCKSRSAGVFWFEGVVSLCNLIMGARLHYCRQMLYRYLYYLAVYLGYSSDLKYLQTKVGLVLLQKNPTFSSLTNFFYL